MEAALPSSTGLVTAHCSVLVRIGRNLCLMILPKEGRKFYENLMLLLLSNGWELRVFVLCVCVCVD